MRRLIVAVLTCIAACTDEPVPFTFIAELDQPVHRDGATTTRIEETYPSYAAGKTSSISIEVETSAGLVGTALVPGYCDALAKGAVQEERRVYTSLSLPLRQSELWCTGTEGGLVITD